MTDVTFGLTLMVVGMGGTMVSLWMLGLGVTLLKRLFPLAAETAEKKDKC